MYSDGSISKDNLDLYFKEFAKLYRKYFGKSYPIEFILVGGASILINYNFRDLTYDVDTLVISPINIKQIINAITDKYELVNGWLNSDFKRSSSYTPKIIEKSEFYKSYYGVLTVRTIKREYLIAMKLKSGREYKHDLSDVAGILSEEYEKGNLISLDTIKNAYAELYGLETTIPEFSRYSLELIYKDMNFKKTFEILNAVEKENEEHIKNLDQEIRATLDEDSIKSMLKQKLNKKNQNSNREAEIDIDI